MTSWKAYILFATILPLVKTENNQRGHKLETTTIPNPQQPFGHEEISEEHKIKVGNRIEPVIFEPQRKIKLSRSTYKVTSYVDFKPYCKVLLLLAIQWRSFVVFDCIKLLGNVVRVYPRIVQGLTLLSA